MSRTPEKKQDIQKAEQREVKLQTQELPKERKDLEKKQEIEEKLETQELMLIDRIKKSAASDPEGLTKLLHEAIKKNCLPAVKSAFDHGAEIVKDSYYSENTLRLAVNKKNLEIVRLVLEHEAPIVNKGDDLNKTLPRAFISGDMGIINLILYKMKDQGLTPDFSSLLLIYAIYSRSKEAVKFALEKGAPIVNEGDDCDKTLTIAFIVGDMEIINLILGGMKDQGLTPDFSSVLLEYAVYSGSEEAVRFALEKSNNGLNKDRALEIAVERKNQKIIDMVLIAGARIEYTSLNIEERQELTQHKKKLLKTIKTEAFDVYFTLAKAFNKEHKNALTSIPPEILRDILLFLADPLLSLAKKAKLLPESLEEEIFTSVEKTYAKRSAGARSSSSSSSASSFVSSSSSSSSASSFVLSEAPVEAAVSNKITGQDSRKNQQKNIGESKEDKSPGRPKVEKSGQLKPVKQSEALNQSEPRTFTGIIKNGKDKER